MRNSRRSMAGATVAAVAALVLSMPAEAGVHKAKAAAKAKPASCPELNAIDPDNDGRMTRIEAYRAGLKTFAKINPDKDRTLEPNELKGRMSAKAFAAADSIIKNGKLSKVEYLREVRLRFRAANPDKDRTIECDEIHSKNGRLLYRLLK